MACFAWKSWSVACPLKRKAFEKAVELCGNDCRTQASALEPVSSSRPSLRCMVPLQYRCLSRQRPTFIVSVKVLQKFYAILNFSVFCGLGIVNRSTTKANLSITCFSDRIFTVSYDTRFSAVSSSSLEDIKHITSSVDDPGGSAR